jgi:hypothetical protein
MRGGTSLWTLALPLTLTLSACTRGEESGTIAPAKIARVCGQPRRIVRFTSEKLLMLH